MRKLSLALPVILLCSAWLATPADAQTGTPGGPPASSLLLLTAARGEFAPAATPGNAALLLRRDQNPVVEVARSTLYGALAGTVLGLAAALVIEESGETVKWGFVLGTFGGFIWGVTYASRQSSTSALIETDRTGHVGIRIPAVDLLTGAPGERQIRMNLLRLSLDLR